MGFFDDVIGVVEDTWEGTKDVAGDVWSGTKGGATAVGLGVPGAVGTFIPGGATPKDIPRIFENSFKLGAEGGFDTEEGRQTLGDLPGFLIDTRHDTPISGPIIETGENIFKTTDNILDLGADASGGLASFTDPANRPMHWLLIAGAAAVAFFALTR